MVVTSRGQACECCHFGPDSADNKSDKLPKQTEKPDIIVTTEECCTGKVLCTVILSITILSGRIFKKCVVNADIFQLY